MSYLEPKLSCSPQRRTHNFPAFPHRIRQKEIPQVGNKSIPVHKLDINRLYNCQMSETKFDRWAFVPTQTHKISSIKSNSPDSTEKKKSFHFKSQQQFQSTSQLFLKRYLKRKDKKSQTQTVYQKQFYKPNQSSSDKRKSFSFDKTTKSLAYIRSNFKKIQTQSKCGQNWPQIIVKAITQNCKFQKNSRKIYTEVQQENNYYDFYLSKYIESNCSKETEKQTIKQTTKHMQETQQQPANNRKPIKFKIMKKHFKPIEHILPSELNSDL